MASSSRPESLTSPRGSDRSVLRKQSPPAAARYSDSDFTPAVGKEFMLHRRLIDGKWISCNGTDEGHMPDSRVI